MGRKRYARVNKFASAAFCGSVSTTQTALQPDMLRPVPGFLVKCRCQGVGLPATLAESQIQFSSFLEIHCAAV